MSDFDDIASLLNDVLEDKPVVLPEDQPATPEEVTAVAQITAPEVTEDALRDFLIEPPEAPALSPPPPDSPEAIEEEVTKVVSSGLTTEQINEGLDLEAEETIPFLDGDPQVAHDHAASVGLADPSLSDDININSAPPISEHVFAEPVDQGAAVPMPTFTSEEIAASVDIRNFATLVTLNTARWQAKVKDRKAAKDAADASGADAEAFEARKRLLVGCDAELKAVHKSIDTARTEHYRLTLPWSMVGVNEVGKRTGSRLMPNTLFLEYTTAMAKAKAEMDTLLDVFEKKYPTLLAIAAQKLGTAFDPTQYPNPASIRQHFRLSFDFNPIPIGEDFKGLQDAQVQKLGTALNSKTQTMLENAMQDAWKTLYETVQHAHAKLSNPDAVFHTTLVTKLQDQAKMLTHLNATKDQRMEDVRKMIEDNLTKWDAKDIRDDDALRKRLAGSAAEIVKHMEEQADATQT